MDGFVIYLMLGLSSLLILFIGSISYTADTPEHALGGPNNVLKRFVVIFPDKGQSKSPTVITGVNYEAVEIEEGGNHSVSFTLKVGKEKDQQNFTLPVPGGDAFRYAVYTWSQPPGRKVDLGELRGKGRGRGQNELELVEPPRATAEDVKAVTDEQMSEFLKSQFVSFVGIHESDVTVTRKPGVAEPDYKFDVRLKNLSGVSGWPHAIRFFFGATGAIKGVPLGHALRFIQDVIVNGLGAAITLMLSVVITAFFIPNMLRKGSLDLLISKPIGRVQLLVYKYIGGLIFIFVLSAFTIGGVWLVMAIQSGHWDPRFLLVIPVLTFTFAIVYSVSTLIAVLTRSAIASILISLAFMLVLYIVGNVKTFFDFNKVAGDIEFPEWAYTLVNLLNDGLPRYKDMDKLTSRLIVDSTLPIGDARLQGVLIEFPSWGGAISVSLIFIVLMLGLASWRLVNRDG